MGGCSQPADGGGAATYTVTFNAGGGAPAPAAQTVAEGGKATAPAAMTRTGFIFGGWFKEAGFTTPWDFSEDRVTGDITRMRRGKSSRFWRTFTFLAVPAAALLSGGLVWALK